MRIVPIAVVAVLIVSLAGCKSKPVSRVYTADMDTTWAAVIRVAEKISEQKPFKVDREKGKIVTGWIYSNIQMGPGEGATTQRSTDIWRGIVICKPTGSSTQVTVRIEKGFASSEDNPDAGGTPNKTIGYMLGGNDTDLQNKFLDKVAAELAPK